MEINAVSVARHRIFCGKPSFVHKQKMDGKKFGELSTEEIQKIRDNAVPATKKKAIKFAMRIFNGTYPISFEILRRHS